MITAGPCYTPPATSRIRRVQGALVEDDELQGVIDFVCQESAPTFSQELVHPLQCIVEEFGQTLQDIECQIL